MTVIRDSKKEFKVLSSKGDKFYNIFIDKNNEFHCDCWWYANRTVPNKSKWGYCSHIKKVKDRLGLN